MKTPKYPKVGDTVLFTPNPTDEVAKSNSNSDPIPGIITRVWGPICVNIKIFPDCGPVQDRTSVVHQTQNPAGYNFIYANTRDNQFDGYEYLSEVEKFLISNVAKSTADFELIDGFIKGAKQKLALRETEA